MSAPVPSPELVTIATRLISNLSGLRWTWPRRTVQDVYKVPFGATEILLAGRPVGQADVASVTDQQGNAISPFEVSDGFRLYFPNWWASQGVWVDSNWPPVPWLFPSQWGRARGFTQVTVVYTYGSQPPLDVQRAINQMAQEMAYAECGQSCKLPERVTSVTREGVSWTLIDPQDFLDKGRTGLYFVDLVLNSYVAGPARSAVWSPERMPPRRLSSTPVP